MLNPSCFTHTTRRNHNLTASICIDCHRGFTGDRCPQPRYPDGIFSTLHIGKGFFIKAAFLVSLKDFCCLNGKRTIYINRDILILPKQILIFDLFQEIQQFLRSTHGKRWNNDASAPLEGFQQNLHEILNIILWLFMQAIAIGGFHDDIIRNIGILWVTNQGLMEVPNITGEQQLFADTVFLQPNFNTGRSEQMSSIQKPDRNTICNGNFLSIRMRNEVFQRP